MPGYVPSLTLRVTIGAPRLRFGLRSLANHEYMVPASGYDWRENDPRPRMSAGFSPVKKIQRESGGARTVAKTTRDMSPQAARTKWVASTGRAPRGPLRPRCAGGQETRTAGAPGSLKIGKVDQNHPETVRKAFFGWRYQETPRLALGASRGRRSSRGNRRRTTHAPPLSHGKWSTGKIVFQGLGTIVRANCHVPTPFSWFPATSVK